MTEEIDSDDELIAEALIGDEAKRFLESDIGKCVLGIAEQESDLARIGLETVDPTDTKAIGRLQNQAALGRMFRGWLIELFNKGEEALGAYQRGTKNG